MTSPSDRRTPKWDALRRGLVLVAGLSLLFASALSAPIVPASKLSAAEPEQTVADRRARRLEERDVALAAARETISECTSGCITPIEATALAFSAGEGRAVPGRFLLDVRGGGRSRLRREQNLYFLNSQGDYSAFGVLVIAFEADAMRALLNPQPLPRATAEPEGDIVVQAHRPRDEVSLSVANMISRYRGKRMLVDGEVSLQWIRQGYGAVSEGRRTRRERGYYQVWVRVTDPAQVAWVGEPAPRD
ncbi:hypothetical protein Ga0102493_11436 [Erythrobacter litoralis]|nr:hypothetical protein Ga0102493_11436 [Erythrobacter litoralis]